MNSTVHSAVDVSGQINSTQTFFNETFATFTMHSNSISPITDLPRGLGLNFFSLVLQISADFVTGFEKIHLKALQTDVDKCK